MISKKDIEHIARLARVEIAAAEVHALEKELSSILDFVAELNEVDTTAVEPLTGGTKLENVFRADEEKSEHDGQKLVSVAPKTRDGYVEVKAVFDR